MPITPSPAVDRAGDLLAQLARRPTESFSVSDLARLADIPRATCDSILQALAAHRLVTRRPDDLRYEIGVGCITLGDAARTANSVLRAAGAEAEQLSRAVSSCAAVCVRDGDEARVIDVFDHGPVFGLRARVGQSIPLMAPFGAVFVAWSTAEIDRWLAAAAAALDTNDVADLDRYRHAIEAVRRRGYSLAVSVPRRPALEQAIDSLTAAPAGEPARRQRDEVLREIVTSEYLPVDLAGDAPVRVTQMSAPIFDADRRVAASIMITGPEFEMTVDEVHALGARIVEAARRATRNAGGRHP